MAIDVLPFVGDLTDVLAAAYAALRPDGVFVATLRTLDADDGRSFVVRPNGRFAHGGGEVPRLLFALGFDGKAVSEPLPCAAGGGEGLPHGVCADAFELGAGRCHGMALIVAKMTKPKEGRAEEAWAAGAGAGGARSEEQGEGGGGGGGGFPDPHADWVVNKLQG